MTERLRGRQTSPLPGPFSKALMMISQHILLSQNLSCKKDSGKTATIAARDCVIRENYQVVNWEPGVGVTGALGAGVGIESTPQVPVLSKADRTPPPLPSPRPSRACRKPRGRGFP